MSSVTRFPPKTIRLAACVVILGGAIWAGIRLFDNPNSELPNTAYVTADFTLVAPGVAGQLSEVLVENNQQVKAGQLLVRIDDRDFRAALMSAQADVAAATASVANYDAEIARLVHQARATHRSDASSLEFERANASRYQNLSQAGAGRTQEQQHATSALAEQLAQQSRNQAVFVATEQNLAVLLTQRDKAAGALAHAEAALEQAKLNLSYTEIRAPIEGKLDRRSAQAGASVTPGAPLLAIVPMF